MRTGGPPRRSGRSRDAGFGNSVASGFVVAEVPMERVVLLVCRNGQGFGALSKRLHGEPRRSLACRWS
jgi:hypothetical protein